MIRPLALTIVVGTLIAVIATVLVLMSNVRRELRRSYCGSKVRGIHQGFVLSAQISAEIFPLPSLLDIANNTVPLLPNQDPTTKNTTAAIFSTLIYGNFFGPEICISPAEVNPAISVDDDYDHTAATAVNPKLALWDPKFAADFTAGVSNLSYAHTPPVGRRLEFWRNTFDSRRAVLGNRGPRIASAAKASAPRVTPDFDTSSTTLRIHGRRDAWEGHIVYDDNSVVFETALWGPSSGKPITYTDAAGQSWHDLFHYDEPDDAPSPPEPSTFDRLFGRKGPAYPLDGGTNNYLSLFTAAGPTPAAFRSIWD